MEIINYKEEKELVKKDSKGANRIYFVIKGMLTDVSLAFKV